MPDATPQPGTPLHGPGGLLGTPGLSTRRKGRKWGQRLKAKQIVGNLYRANDGKFSSGGDNPVAAKPKRGVQYSKPPKPIKRAAPPKKAAAPKKRASGGKKPTSPKPKDPAVQARQEQRDRERAEDRATRATDRAQRQQDRQARLERQAARDRERLAKDMERATADAKKKLDAKQPKAGGGGSSSKKPSADDKRQERSKKADATAGDVGLTPRDVDSLRQAAAGLGGVSNPAMAALGLIGPDGMTTDQGRRALSALERGDVRGYQAAVQDAKARQGREQGATQRRQQVEARRHAREAAKRQQLTRMAERARSGAKLTEAQRDRLTDAGLAEETGGMWRVKVFKDASGRHRWLARTTTAYRDRDGEIISAAALDADSVRMTEAKTFGPLRYWHVGQPDPFAPHAPWGPGLDIGDCDYSTLIGRTRIESGTFRDNAIAQKVAQQADQYELSPGFFHPIDQPDARGVFHAIRTFERSLVPVAYGRASNLFTGLAVKEHRMDVNEMEKRFKAAIADLGLDATQAQALGAQLVATEKDAAQQGIAFKSEEQPVVKTPAPPDEIVIGGVVYTVKAAPPPMEEAAVAVETQADGDMLEEVVEEVIEPEAEMSGDYLGDMSWDEFAAKLADLLAPVLKMQEMVKSITDMGGELKSMYSGAATKAAGELAALKAQQQQLAEQIASIEGRQPATILPDELESAFKSSGPAAPAKPDDPATVEALNDPTRPFAQIAARTMPSLYTTDPGGAFAGWTPPPAP